MQKKNRSVIEAMKPIQIMYNIRMMNYQGSKEHLLRAALDANKITLKEYLQWIQN